MLGIKIRWRLLAWNVEKIQKRFEKMFQTKNNNFVVQSQCSVCGIKKSTFVKEQEAKGLLSNLGIKPPLSKIPLLNVLF